MWKLSVNLTKDEKLQISFITSTRKCTWQKKNIFQNELDLTIYVTLFDEIINLIPWLKMRFLMGVIIESILCEYDFQIHTYIKFSSNIYFFLKRMKLIDSSLTSDLLKNYFDFGILQLSHVNLNPWFNV